MLAVPRFAFAQEVDNLTGTPTAGTPGANFTAKANSADGTVVAVLGSLAFDVHYLVIALGGLGATTTDSSCLADVMVDPAGGTSWAGGFIDSLVCGFSTPPVAGAAGLVARYAFPIYIPATTSVGIRARTAHTADITTGRCVMWAYGQPSRPDQWWCGQKCETLGCTVATSKGTTVTPGNSGAAGTYTSVGGVTSARYGSIQLGINGSDATMLAVSYHWVIGVSGAKLPGTPAIYTSCTTTELMSQTGAGQFIPCDIGSGVQLQVMGTCSGTAEAHTVALYGVY